MKLVLVPDCIDRAEDGFETAEGVFGEMVDRVGASISYCVPRSFEALGAGGRAGCASDNCDGLPVFDRRSRGGGVHAFRSDLIGRHTREPSTTETKPQARLPYKSANHSQRSVAGRSSPAGVSIMPCVMDSNRFRCRLGFMPLPT